MKIFSLLLFFVLFYHPIYGEENSSTALFEKAFGKKPSLGIHRFYVTLKIDETPKGDTPFIHYPDKDEVHLHQLLDHYQFELNEEHYTQLQSKENPNHTISLSDLKALGYSVEYSEADFTLDIKTPSGFFSQRTHNLSSSRSIRTSLSKVSPDPFSGGVNIGARQGYSDTRINSGLDAAQVDFEAFFNLHDFVFENDFRYLDRQGEPWKFSRKVMTYDLPSKLLRLQAGDIRPNPQGFQSTNTIGGISISKDYRLNPTLRITPLGEKEIYLDTPSTVEIYVNDILRRRLHLNAGSHILDQIPSHIGANNISIKIIDSFNREEVISSRFLYDSTLLDEGISRYGFHFGIKSEETLSALRYLSKEPMWTGYYEKGLSKNHTLLAYGEGDENVNMLGFRSTHSANLGKFSLEYALSRINNFKADHGLGFIYASYPGALKFFSLPSTINVSAMREGKNLATVASPDLSRNRRWSFLSVVNTSVSNNAGLGLSCNYSIYRNMSTRPFLTSLQYTTMLKDWVDLSLSFAFEKTQENLYDRRASIHINWEFPESHSRVSSNYESEGSRKTVNYRKNWKQENNDFDYELSPSLGIDEDSLSTSAGWNAERFASTLYYTGTDPHGDPTASMTHNARLSLSTALVFSGNQYAITRPVKQSFLLVGKGKGVDDNHILVNPLGLTYDAKSLGPMSAVIPNVRNYEGREIFIDVPNLPVGSDIGTNQWLVIPRHRSGLSIRVESLSQILLQGYLLDNQGKPIPLIAGHIISMSDPSQAVTFFTNERGKFRVLGINEVAYSIKLMSDDFEEVALDIPEGTKGFYKLGKIIMPESVEAEG